MDASTDIIGAPFNRLPTKQEIIKFCEEHGSFTNHLKYPVDGSTLAYIKYGPSVTLGEAWTQIFAFNAFNSSAILVPRVYWAFETRRASGIVFTYIFMEFIDGKTVRDCLEKHMPADHDWIIDAVANAVSQMMEFCVPQGAAPGPVGGGCIQHPFFKDRVAPKQYSSIEELQAAIKSVSNKHPCFVHPF
jgi:hypothetical protein